MSECYIFILEYFHVYVLLTLRLWNYLLTTQILITKYYFLCTVSLY